MDPRFEPLFYPWKVGNVEIKNRIVLCPMGVLLIVDGAKPL